MDGREPAFPNVRTEDPYRTDIVIGPTMGMDLRTYIASAVLPVFIHEYVPQGAAIRAVEYADALIAELSK